MSGQVKEASYRQGARTGNAGVLVCTQDVKSVLLGSSLQHRNTRQSDPPTDTGRQGWDSRGPNLGVGLGLRVKSRVEGRDVHWSGYRRLNRGPQKEGGEGGGRGGREEGRKEGEESFY